MARRAISLDERIEKAEAAMLAAKAKYDKTLNEMEKLLTKRKQINDKKYLMSIIQATRLQTRLSNLYSQMGKNKSEC